MSLSAYSTLDSGGCTRIMGVAMFVALLHAALYTRVWCWFHNAEDTSNIVGITIFRGRVGGGMG